MKKITLIAAVILIACAQFYAQQSAESQQLSQQIRTLYQQGKFDEAILLAEKSVEIEKKASKSSESYALALFNLGMLHKERMSSLKAQLAAKTIENRVKAHRTVSDDLEASEDLMRGSLKIYQQPSLADSPRAALLKFELAWLMSNYLSYATLPTRVKERTAEAEKLYTEALAAQEKTAGSASEITLRTALALGDFYSRWIDFEKALPLYERFVEFYEKKPGAEKTLVPALRGLAEIYLITDRRQTAVELAKRIESITGKPEPLPDANPNLALRAKKLAKVDNERFIAPESSNDPSNIFALGVVLNPMTPMERRETRHLVVNIIVGEDGDVIEARLEKEDKFKKDVEEAALKSKFRPFLHNGKPYKMRGSILYVYLD